MKKILFTLSTLFCLLATGCYYDKEEELYPQGTGSTCVTTSVSYSTTINIILQNYGCISCHSSASAPGGVVLQGYTNVKTQATNGRLYGSINHSPGYVPMPLGRPKMNTCDIAKVKAWIDAGAPNN